MRSYLKLVIFHLHLYWKILQFLTKMMIYWWAWPQPLSGLESRILWIVPGPIVCLPQLISSLEDFSIIGS